MQKYKKQYSVLLNYLFFSKIITFASNNYQNTNQMISMDNTALDKQVFVAFKLGETKYMESLFREGLIYMNSVKYFRDSLYDGQGDKYEGAKIVRNGKPIEYRDTISFEKIFCLWHINNISLPQGKGVSLELLNEDTCEVTIDTKEYIEFSHGKPEDLSIVVIHNLKEFHNRLRSNLNKKYKGCYCSNAVNYYDPYGKNEIFPDVFMKPNTLQYQNELRYLVMDDREEPLQIKIGNMEDIAKLFPVSEIKIKLNYNIIQ